MRCTVFAVALGVVLGTALTPRPAAANGRFPATVNTRFQPGDPELILLPSTFGLLVSKDDGATFHWVCEDVIGYGGTYDPDYALAVDGRIYSTTFEGLRVSRDGSCTYETVSFYDEPATDTPTTEPLESFWVGEVEVASDGRIWATTSTGGQANDVYVSSDGERFFASNLRTETSWWKAIRIAESDPSRIYVTGFTPTRMDENGDTIPAEALLYRSSDGGASWTQLPTGDFAFGSQPNLFLAGVSPTDPDLVFARVLGANEPVGDALYRSTDGGDSWTKVLDFADTLRGFVIRGDGQTVIAGSVGVCPEDEPQLAKGCVRISSDGGASWEVPASEPKMACLGERDDGTLFSCGANWEPDLFALGRSSDGQSWEKVVRFSEIAGPLACDPGTIQNECAALVWPGQCEMLGICEPGGGDAGPGGGDAGTGDGGGGGDDGCLGCTAGGAAGGLLVYLLGFAGLGVLGRRRRSRE